MPLTLDHAGLQALEVSVISIESSLHAVGAPRDLRDADAVRCAGADGRAAAAAVRKSLARRDSRAAEPLLGFVRA
jgi:hypothetical protein